MPTRPCTVTELPGGYKEVKYFSLTQGRRLIWLNIAAVGIFFLFVPLFFGWLALYHGLLNSFLVIDDLLENPSNTLNIILLLMVIPLHECLHGLGMMYYGHSVRYGIKWTKGVVYATSDNGLFWRHQFIVVSLTPLIIISIVMMLASLFVSSAFGLWLMLVASLNASGAIGDLWMVWVAYHYPAHCLIRDEADGMRIFVDNIG